MRYTWLFLDADGTLFDYARAEAGALEMTFAGFKVPYLPEYRPAYQHINAALWQQLEKGNITPGELQHKRFADLFSLYGLQLPVEAFSEQYLENLGKCSFLIEGAFETLAALHPACKMLVLTNGLSKVQRARLAGSPIEPFISALVISQEVGAAKPAAAIFDAAFAMVGNPAKTKVLMVGDSLTSDIRGGIQYGIDTCWFNPQGEPRPEDMPITYEIRSLPGLLELVKT